MEEKAERKGPHVVRGTAALTRAEMRLTRMGGGRRVLWGTVSDGKGTDGESTGG